MEFTFNKNSSDLAYDGNSQLSEEVLASDLIVCRSNFLFVFVLLLSVVQAGPFFYSANLDDLLSLANLYLANNTLISNNDCFFLLQKAMRYGTESQLDFVLDSVFTANFLARQGEKLSMNYLVEIVSYYSIPRRRKVWGSFGERGVELKFTLGTNLIQKR